HRRQGALVGGWSEGQGLKSSGRGAPLGRPKTPSDQRVPVMDDCPAADRWVRMRTDDGMAGASSDAWLEPEPSLVMVVDDSATVRAILESHLVEAGYRVCSAGDGEDALRLAHQLGPDLLLVDVTMPMMDGFELTRRLREDPRTSGASIILITARDLSADKQ